MILEIEKPRPSTLPSLDYNEGKVLRGVAELVGYANMESVSREGIYALFGRYERGACYPTQERSCDNAFSSNLRGVPTFMRMNPSPPVPNISPSLRAR